MSLVSVGMMFISVMSWYSTFMTGELHCADLCLQKVNKITSGNIRAELTAPVANVRLERSFLV